MGVLLVLGLCFATAFTLYHFVGINLFLFSVGLVSLLIQGFVTGWVGLDWSNWGWSFGPNFPSSSR